MPNYAKLYEEMMVSVDWYVTRDGKVITKDKKFKDLMQKNVSETVRRRGANSIVNYVFAKMKDESLSKPL